MKAKGSLSLKIDSIKKKLKNKYNTIFKFQTLSTPLRNLKVFPNKIVDKPVRKKITHKKKGRKKKKRLVNTILNKISPIIVSLIWFILCQFRCYLSFAWLVIDTFIYYYVKYIKYYTFLFYHFLQARYNLDIDANIESKKERFKFLLPYYKTLPIAGKLYILPAFIKIFLGPDYTIYKFIICFIIIYFVSKII